MNKKILLTSFVALGFAMPAMAEMTDSNSFPNASNNEYMQANTRYIGAATSTNMAGVYENSVYANAQYTTNNYTVNAGFYLPADSENPNTTCTAGSFCPGLQSPVQYNATTAQGIESCPTGYTNSATGAKANTECYRTCATTDVAHASSVSGQMYYNGTSGDGVNACSAEGCVNGWHVKPGLDLSTTIGTGQGASRADITNNGAFTENSASHGQSYYGITENNTFAVDYGSGKGIVTGQARCSTTPGTANWSAPYSFSTETSLTDETGQEGAGYCYCTVTGYKDTNGTTQSLSAPWVFYGGLGGAGSCAGSCASYCAGYLQFGSAYHLAFRAAVFGAVPSSPAMCEANTITINWSDADQTDIDANDAGTVTYGGDVRTPVKAQTKKGKTFSGWVFSTTAPTE